MRLPSVMNHNFANVPQANISRSRFDRSHGYKTTFDEGYLIPFYVDEALPGDTFNMKATLFSRLATPITPIMDNLYLSTFFYAVPIRLIWDNFQKFMGEQNNPGDSIDYLVPQITSPAGGFTENTIYDYMGIPTKVAGLKFNALHLRAYNLMWNQCFRDQNMQASVNVPKGDGPDAPTLFSILRRGKRFDYFTGSLPFLQKGPAVTIPLGTSAPVRGTGNQFSLNTPSGERNLTGNGTTSVLFGSATAAGTISVPTNSTAMVADLSAAASATINLIRTSITMQQFLERDARGGTRYPEIIYSHFNVHSPDARMQRPEFLGGTTVRLDITQVPQTSAQSGQPTPQGNLAAYGTGLMNGNRNGFVKSFVEHCVLIGVMCVHADLTYQQGLDPMWSRRTRYDFYWPTFAHLGMQGIKLKEIYAQGTAADDTIFGYQERYAEYRFKFSQITGLFRSNATGTLDFWHLSQKFDTAPTLGDVFISERPPVGRVVAVPSQPHFLLDAYMDLQCARAMPVYSVPGVLRF